MNGALSIGGFSSRAGSLLLVLLLLVAQAACRSQARELEDEAALAPDADYGAVDNVEVHHVKIVDGVMHEDHPVVMYKEDFVSEDYEPNKNETTDTRKRYRHAQRQRHRRPAHQPDSEQEKIYFDKLSESPIASSIGEDDTSAPRFAATELLQPSKEEWLLKRPKKYHSRQRRNTNDYYRHGAVKPAIYYLPQPLAHYPTRPPVPAVFWQPVAGPKPRLTSRPEDIKIRIDGTDESAAPALNVWHNSNPADADFSLYDQERPPATGGPSGTFNGNNNNINQSPWEARPVTDRPAWGFSNARRPNQAASRPQTPPPTSRPATTTRRPPPPPRSTPKVSSCVWAIVNCCTRGSDKVRYYCFEEYGCHGAFWDSNPCATQVRNRALAHVANNFQ